MTKSSQTARSKWRLGFVPLVDCAPLVVAHELGFFARRGLNVTLSRELGWATVRDKLLFGELDAAHALAPMVFLLALGLGGSTCPCFTPLILNAQGNSITLSRRLWNAGVRNASALRDWLRESRRHEPLTLGIVFPYSSHHLLLRNWLASAGLVPGRDVKLVVVPPPQMVTNLKAGNLDGFCVGEPWGTLAEETGVGCCVARSSTLEPLHPEKALLIRQESLEARQDECLALAGAVLDACAYCADPGNAWAIAELLDRKWLSGISRHAIAVSMRATASTTSPDARMSPPDVLFYGSEVNEPTLEKAGTLARLLRQADLLPQSLSAARLAALFRCDLYEQIQQPLETSANHEIERPFETSFTNA